MLYQTKLENEIAQLRIVLSVDIPQELREAAETGDIRENSDYAAVLSRQHMVNLRMEQLMLRLKAYTQLDISTIPTDRIGIGSHVVVRHKEDKMLRKFKIVMFDVEDNEDHQYTEITTNSPAGKALMNKKVGDTVIVKSPTRILTYIIKDLKTIHECQKET